MRVERSSIDRAFDAVAGPSPTFEIPPLLLDEQFTKPQHWFLSEAVRVLDQAIPGEHLAVELEIASKRIRHFWYSTMAGAFLAHYEQFGAHQTYDGGWIDFDGARVRVTVQPIEGPVDGTIYRVERTTPTEEGSLEFFLDEAGQPEEVMSPMKVVSKLKREDGEVVEEITATFRQGRIEKLVRTEYKGEYTGDNPPYTKRTEFDFSYVVRFLVRPR